MIDIDSKYDNMHKNGIFYALIYINNNIISCIIFMLSKCTLILKGTIRISLTFKKIDNLDLIIYIGSDCVGC